MRRLVLVGHDAPLWLAAAVLHRALPPGFMDLTLVALPEEDGPAKVHATQPPLESLHSRIGLDETALLAATGGTFSAGQNVTGPGSRPFFHAWSAYGAPIEGQPFFLQWLRARADGMNADLQQFCPGAIAAINGRMMLPGSESARFGRCDYGYHLQAHAYAGLLRRHVEHAGCTIHTSEQAHPLPTADGQGIAAIRLDDGQIIAGNLFIDLTQDALLLHDLPGARRVGGDGGSATRCLTALAPPFTRIPAFTELRAGPNGWLRLKPTRAATGVEYHFDAGEDDGIALDAANRLAGCARLDGVSFETRETGRFEAPWIANCIAMGSAAERFHQFHDVDLHAVQLGLVHFLALLPPGEDFSAERDEYNRILASSFARIRDFQQAFRSLAPWPGAFWERGRAIAVSPELAHRIALFRVRGEIAPHEDESFSEDSWRVMLTGLGVRPESWPPAADRLDPAQLRGGMRTMLQFIRDAVLAQPDHARCLPALNSGA
ncbi:tryptophan 7-halogenase [Novosphingobium sp. BL-8H]|uniref:tryptophan 7-halogenase n=1 Tax=Novosphingobium sp. BL-8H TaxID=3127640 RepID=UPI0037578942